MWGDAGVGGGPPGRGPCDSSVPCCRAPQGERDRRRAGGGLALWEGRGWGPPNERNLNDYHNQDTG